MMSKKQRWCETVVNCKSNTTTQKKGGKDRLTVPVSSGGKPPCSSTSQQPRVAFGRTNSQSSKSSDLTAGVCKAGGSLKRGTLSHQSSVVHPGNRQASHQGRAALRLSSSRSFCSLHTTSLAAAPFMRSSHSLSRLDQRATGRESDDEVPRSQIKKGQMSEKKTFNSGLSLSEEQTGKSKDRYQVDNVEKMKTNSSSEPPESSSTAYYHHCNKIKEQTKDGVYTLCAMTSGMRRNWVQAVLKNVRPSLTPDARSPHSSSSVQRTENPNSCLQEHKNIDWAEESHQREMKLGPEKDESSAVGNGTHPPISCADPEEEGHSASYHQCPPLVDTTKTSLTDTSLRVEGAGSQVYASTEDDNYFNDYTNMGGESKQSGEQVKTTSQHEVLEVSVSTACEQLVKEKEASQVPELSGNLQDELQHERARRSVHSQTDLPSNSVEEALDLEQLQRINHDLRTELAAQKRSQEEAREAELQRRVDLLAQQAQLLVTGDATALAQAHLEQDRRRFREQQMEWERSMSSLKVKLTTSEEQRREAECRLTQLQQEVQCYRNLQQEADRLQKHLQEVKAQLCANEDAQAEKEAQLEKHLMLLQASQDRERRSLASSLKQAERHSQDLQERLDRAEQQVENLNKTQTLTREIEEAQQQLQEELSKTVCVVQKLQEEREQLHRSHQELQNQLSEADGEVSRLQSRLKSEETHYYNLEHSYERVCEELQVATGKVQQRESEMQDIREGYERLLDRKEQELSEVLLKMEVLGNSLEETEMKLNEASKNCSCASSQLKDALSEHIHDEQITEPLTLSETDVVERNNNPSDTHPRIRSRSIDPSYQNIVTAGDEPERFMQVIQLLERKLYVTEEKLRDITQMLEDHQGAGSCQDPHLYSQLTQCRATAQHLGLLLHSQAKQSQHFAQETENCCRMLVGRFQVALNIIQACRERLQAGPINTAHLEKQLANAAACLQQGEQYAEKQQHASHHVSKGEAKILNDETVGGAQGNSSAECKLTRQEDDVASVKMCLKRELFVVGKMLSVLQSHHCVGLSSVRGEDEGSVAHRYKNLISQRLVLKDGKTNQNGETAYGSEEPLEDAIVRVCAEAELIYAGLAEMDPSDLAPYEEQVKVEGCGLEEATKPEETVRSDKTVDPEKKPEWLERLLQRLQRRAKFLKHLCQESSDGPAGEHSMDDSAEKDSDEDMNWIQEEAKLIYLAERLHLDLEQAWQQSELLKNQLQTLRKEEDTKMMDAHHSFNHTVCQLQEDNSLLREELERAEQKLVSVETGNQRLLEAKFQDKIRELQKIHEEEMKHLHGYYIKEKETKTWPDASGSNESSTSADDHGVTVMEEIHRKLISDLQQQHQTEVAELLKEKDQLLQEETGATMAAIVALRRAHKQELEKCRLSQCIKDTADVTQLHTEYEKEIQLLQTELEVLSVQHTQKCLENSQLSQELQDERKSLVLFQKENQELKKKRETDETPQQHFSVNGSQSGDLYEMEVILRAREAEMQFLRQEASALREELKIARMDKLYAQNKLKALHTHSQDQPRDDVNKPREDVKFATLPQSSGQSLKDSMTSTSNAALQKKTEKSSLRRQMRAVRSKSLKEGLSFRERMKLFDFS